MHSAGQRSSLRAKFESARVKMEVGGTRYVLWNGSWPPKDTLEKMGELIRGQITSAEYVEGVKQA